MLLIRRHNRARCQADNPLTLPSEIVGPLLKSPKTWVAYRLAKVGKRLGVVHGETEKEALANAQKEFAKTELERKCIYLRAQ